MKRRVRNITGKNNVAVTLADQVTRGMECPVKVIEAHLVKLMLVVHSDHIVAEGNEGHMDGFDSAQQIRINRSGQNDAVNQSMLLKNGRQVDAICMRLLRIMQSREHDLLVSFAC